MNEDRPDKWIQSQIQLILHGAEQKDVDPMVVFAALMGAASKVKTEVDMDQYEEIVKEIEESMLEDREADLDDDDDDSDFKIGGPLE